MVQKDRGNWRRLDLRHTSHELSPEFTCSCSDVYSINYYEFTTYERERERARELFYHFEVKYNFLCIFFLVVGGSLCVIAGVFANLFLPLAFFHVYFVTQSKSCLALNYGKPTLRKRCQHSRQSFLPSLSFPCTLLCSISSLFSLFCHICLVTLHFMLVKFVTFLSERESAR